MTAVASSVCLALPDTLKEWVRLSPFWVISGADKARLNGSFYHNIGRAAHSTRQGRDSLVRLVSGKGRPFPGAG